MPMTFKVCRQMRRGILECVRSRVGLHIDLIDGRKPSAIDLSKYDGFMGHPDEVVNWRDVPMVVNDPDTGWESPRVKSLMKKQGVMTCDTEAVGRLAADFLVGEGFENFAYVGELGDPAWSVKRGRAFAARLREKGFSCDIYPVPRRGTESDARRLGRYLRKLPHPTAILAAYDGRAREVNDAARQVGLFVPGDIALLGVDNDDDLCEMMNPPLSSIELSAENAAREAMKRLVQTILVPDRVGRIVFGPGRIVRRSSTQKIEKTDDPIVSAALNYIVAHATQEIGVEHVAKACTVSRRMLERRFAESLAKSVGAVIADARLDRVVILLTDSERKIEEIAKICGYSSAAYLSRVFHRRFGMTMQQYRKKKDGTRS